MHAGYKSCGLNVLCLVLNPFTKKQRTREKNQFYLCSLEIGHMS